MKPLYKLFFLVVFLSLNVSAQTEFFSRYSKTDKLFNAYPAFVNNIHTAHFLNNERMIIELADLTDYDLFDGLDSVLDNFRKDIAFYKDSMPMTGTIRIDYVKTEDSRERIMRFRRYNADGDLFVKRDGEVAKLKVEQDTIHITLQKKPNDKSDHAHFYDYPAQVMFCLNSYTNLDKYIASKGFLKSVVDTMHKAITPKKTNPESEFPFTGPSQSTIDYYPYNTNQRMRKSSVILPHGKLEAPMSYNRNKFAAYANIAAGVVRNSIVPMAEAGITKLHFGRPLNPDRFGFISLYASSLFFFATDGKGEQIVNDNYFINLESGTAENDDDMLGVKVRSTSLGGGYLAFKKGDYFKGTTVKVFMGLRLQSGISIYPEVIATNNFKQIFPGITVKIFGFKR